MSRPLVTLAGPSSEPDALFCGQSEAVAFSDPIWWWEYLTEIAARFRVTLYTIPSTTPKMDKIDSNIINCIRNSEGLGTTEIASQLGISSRMTRERLKKLVKLKLLVEIGTGPFDPHKKYKISS